MSNRAYYVLAALLLLATVPMYRAMWRSAHPAAELPSQDPVRDPLKHSVQRVVVPEPVVRQVGSLSQVPLLAGERCYGGVVVMVNGSTYTQVSDAVGPMRCSGRFALPRR